MLMVTAILGIYRIALTLGRKAHIVLNDQVPAIEPMVELFKGNTEYEGDMIIGNQQAIEAARLRMMARYLSFSSFLQMPSKEEMYLFTFRSISAIRRERRTSSTPSSASS